MYDTENNTNSKNYNIPFSFNKQDVSDVLNECRAVSGYGGYHTANPDAKNPKPYTSVTFQELTSMVKSPECVPKDQAQWAIFSTTHGPDARVHDYQRKNGQYFILSGDLDDVEGLTFLDVLNRVKAAIPDRYAIVYTSKSAQEAKPKSRVLVPLSKKVPGRDYAMVAKILNDRLGTAGLPPDRATERPGQLFYLPNRGEFYKYHIEDGPLLDPYQAFKAEIIAEQARLEEEQQERDRRHQVAIQKAQARIDTGQVNPIDAFKENYPVELALERYGYNRRVEKYISPLSESGNPGVTVRDGKWYSHHSSDSSIGQPGKDGGSWGDAFDLFVHFEHGGNFNRAVTAAGEMFTTVDSVTGQAVSITQKNQMEHRRQQADKTEAGTDQPGADILSHSPGERTRKTPISEYVLNHSKKLKKHPYVTKKQIKLNLFLVDRHNNLVFPFNDNEDRLQTVLLVSIEKDVFVKKKNNNGKGFEGAAYKIDGAQGLAYVCMGVATGHSIHEATGATVYCVGRRENFKDVLPWVKNRHETVIVAADNDHNEAGLRSASKAAHKNGLQIVIPLKKGMDFNAYAIDQGTQMAKTILEDPQEPDKKYIDDKNNSDEYLAALLGMNARHACIMIGGKFQILNKYIDPLTDKPEISFSSVFDFKNRYANKEIIKIIPDENGGEKKKSVPIAEEWLKHTLRQELEGIVFDPSEKVPSEYYNLWTGLAHAPREGNWNLLEAHILNVIAGGDYEIYTWILAWMARIVQDPGGERPGTSIVLRGKQGTGKGLFVNFFGQLFGKHFSQIAHATQVTGRFNSHFKDALLVFVDEGFWAGDKQAEGILKNLVTEPFITVEQKGKDIVRVKNHVNLIMASNNEWVVPAGLEERRFFVLDVSDGHQQDHKYFKAIVDQMENGGIEAMLYDLFEMDISQVNLRKFKQTAGLFEQKIYSMDTIQKFWFERLKDGVLRHIDPGEPDQYGELDWGEICRKKFYDDYLAFADSLKDRFPLSPQQFGISLRKMCKEVRDTRPKVNGRRIRVYRFPSLEGCRREFSQLVGAQINWDDDGHD